MGTVSVKNRLMNVKRLKNVLKVQSATYENERMLSYILNQFEEIKASTEQKMSVKKDKEGNLYITKGTAKTYPCVVAHTDTVHDIIKNYKVFEGDGVMFAMNMHTVEMTGIGGDDKVGIYVALEALRTVDTIKVAFFVDEEHGCLGSRRAIMDWFKDVEFVLQCDRQGYEDFVRSIFGVPLFDDVFQFAINGILDKYNKVITDDGGMTDVYQLVANGLNVCVANISCGYYMPHTENEYVEVNEVELTLSLVLEIIEGLSGTVWKNTRTKPYKRYTTYSKVKSKKSKGIDSGLARDFSGDAFDDRDYRDQYRHFENAAVFNSFVDHCSKCGSVSELMHDENEAADWCFNCNDYTNVYTKKAYFDDLLEDGDEELMGYEDADVEKLLDRTYENVDDYMNSKKK